jgi:hypothetical protein
MNCGRSTRSLAAVVGYLDAIQQDVIDNVDDFIKPPEPTLAALMGGLRRRNGKGSFAFRRYKVNLLVAHEERAVLRSSTKTTRPSPI